MERLTKRLQDGFVLQRTELEDNSYEKCMERLAEYEDLGITPGQLLQIDGMYADRCREVAELKKRLESVYRGKVKSKYCNTCKEIEEIDFFNKPFSSDGELIKVLNAQLVTKIFDRKRKLRGCMAYRARKINFCPECGKKTEKSKKMWRM